MPSKASFIKDEIYVIGMLTDDRKTAVGLIALNHGLKMLRPAVWKSN